MGIPICGACRRPIEERVVTALGKVENILEDSLDLTPSPSPSVKIQINVWVKKNRDKLQ